MTRSASHGRALVQQAADFKPTALTMKEEFDGIGPGASQYLTCLIPKQHSIPKQRLETVYAGWKRLRPDAKFEWDLHFENISASLCLPHADRQQHEQPKDHPLLNAAVYFHTISS